MTDTIDLKIPNTDDADTEGVDTPEEPAGASQEPQNTTEAHEDGDDPQEPQEPAQDAGEEPEQFSREYVQDLRAESAKYRTRAKAADDLAKRLHTELVRSNGRLADPTDLPFDEAHLEDSEALTAAVDELLAAKPHLARRRVTGSIGQGETGAPSSVSLGGMLRSLA